jgi:mono/diheme cytochrome c family protein
MTLRQITAFTALCLAACVASAQEKPVPVVKKVPVKRTSPTSGKEMYTQYCAVCHGVDGKGTGPAAAALKTPPSDLTTLAKHSEGGKYPSDRVTTLLKNGTELAAHGSSDMPIWGSLFKSLDPMHDTTVEQRIKNLNDYLASIQAK